MPHRRRVWLRLGLNEPEADTLCRCGVHLCCGCLATEPGGPCVWPDDEGNDPDNDTPEGD